MRTVLDLTEDTANDGLLPEPSAILMEDDEVVFELREVELRMTMGQFVGLVDAMNRWLFRDGRFDVDPNDENYCASAEHELLRKVVKSMALDGCIGDVELDLRTRTALRTALSEDRIDAAAWRSQGEEIRELTQVNENMRAEIDLLRAGKRRARKAVSP